jgi:hypothetical protein
VFANIKRREVINIILWHEIRAEERRKQFSEHEIIDFAAGVHFVGMRLCLSTAAINGPNVRDIDRESPKN